MDYIPLTKLYQSVDDIYDVFFCSASFEERCFSIPLHLNLTKINKTFVSINTKGGSKVNFNGERLIEILGENTEKISIDMEDPLITTNKFLSVLFSLKENEIKRILIDITTYSHEVLLILLRLLISFFPEAEIHILYNNAEDYSINDKPQNKWLSRGVGKVRSIIGYPGLILPTRKTFLLLVVGFEYDRAIRIIESFEPEKLCLINGKTSNPTTEKNTEAMIHFSELVSQTALSYTNVERLEIPCDNIDETFSILERKIFEIKDLNIIIAPLNNKLSTIAVGLLGIRHKKIQVGYAPALTYNVEFYSQPGEKCYRYTIHNSDFQS